MFICLCKLLQIAESLEKKEKKLQAKKAAEKLRQEQQLKEAERLREVETAQRS